MTINIKSFFIILFFFLAACDRKPDTLFRILPPEQTGIAFQNDVQEDEYLNIISNEYLYNGAGVGIGDFNNDGLQDIFFSGSQVINRLYLNNGDLTFRDVTLEAHIAGRDRWSTGVAVADVNGDGLQDIYVCATNHLDPEMRRNKLFINQGLNENGIPVFAEKAKEYGVDDDGYSTHAAFFDYDRDGDLDLYVLTNFLDTPTPNKYRPKKNGGTAPSNDRLYRNNGDGTFTNVTLEAGIVYEGYGLGISIVDINRDGWRDIYITNDYLTNDLLYINNGDGTFTNRIADYIKHQTHSAMGHDIADIDNDGLPDIFTLDMLPEDNEGMKRMHGVTRYQNMLLDDRFGYQPQYKRNMLQINNGPDAFGNHLFSEIGLYAGVIATEWSWAALLADYDNDGYRDLFVSNGYPRDVTDLDYAVSGMSRGKGLSNEEVMMLIPVRSMNNYIFRNNSDYTFTNMSKEWGMGNESFSNGAAWVDLDNDGDLDIVTTNYNEPAMVYENTLYEKGKEKDVHFLQIKPEGPESKVLGARIYAFAPDGKIWFEDHNVFRGYRSTVDRIVHFGLGKTQKIDSLVILWADGKRQKLMDVEVDETITVSYDPQGTAKNYIIPPLPDSADYLFKKITEISWKHEEKPFNDYNLQNTIPHQFSRSGPALAVGDLNGDEKYDLLIGGSAGKSATMFLRSGDGFIKKDFTKGEDMAYEDQGILIFDADNDGDNDVYIVSGGVEHGTSPANYRDRLYVNDGTGHFSWERDALPETAVSGSCVKAADYDNDGDLDLFAGGRVWPGSYPRKVSSFILQNDAEHGIPYFSDSTVEICPDLIDIGLVTDALWTDFDNDGMTDLIVVGEWMPVTFFKNENGRLTNITEETGISDKTGWWRSITGGDFDNDGDIDYIVGNEGLNSFFKAPAEEPLTAWHADFDNNGRYDVIISSWEPSKDGTRKPFPVHLRSDLGKQLPMTKKRFTTYEDYGKATIHDLLTPEEEEIAKKSIATWMASSYIENLGNGKFAISTLPGRAQWAPLYGMQTGDFNNDYYLDVLIVGNFFGNSLFWGHMDALDGLLLLGDGKGGFECLDYTKTGFLAPGDAKALVALPWSKDKMLYVASQNRDSLLMFEQKRDLKLIELRPDAAFAEIIFSDAQKRKQEFYWGNGYLSQPARVLVLPESVKSFEIH